MSPLLDAIVQARALLKEIALSSTYTPVLRFWRIRAVSRFLRRSHRSAMRAAAPMLTAALCVAASAMIAGCATTESVATERDSPASEAMARLKRLADKQARRPVARAQRALAPPGVPDQAVDPIPQDDQRARLPLEQAIEHVLESGASDADAESESTPQDDQNDQSQNDAGSEPLRSYITGRSRLLAGDVHGAIDDLQAAASADSSAAAPWRELGKLQLEQGDRLSAMASFRKALQRDPDDLHSLVQVGLWSLDRREPERAARRLARVWRARESADPAIPHVVGFALGRALHELGYTAAGAEAMRRALDLPDRFHHPTTYRSQLERVYRRRAEGWRDVGDAALRLERWRHALRAYDEAADLQSLDPGAILPRRVYAAMRLGQPARAAMALLNAASEAEGLIDDRRLALIRYIRDHSGLGPLLASGLRELSDRLPPQQRRLAASRLARARAASLPDDRAIRALRARLAEAPADRGALRDLFARIDREDRRRALNEADRLTEASPLHVGRYAAAAVRAAPSAEALLSAWNETFDSDSAKTSRVRALLRAELLQSAGRASDAREAIEQALSRDRNFAPAVIAAVELFVENGDRQRAESLLSQIKVNNDPRLRYAKAAALRSLGRRDQALETLEPLLERTDQSAGARLEALALAAELAQSLGRYAQAEKWYRAAMKADPTREEIYAGLIALYAPSGPLSDESSLSDVVRRLRRAVPSSRTLRWLRAQELTSAGQYDQAERVLLSLAEEELTQPVVELLTTVWIRTGSAQRAEEWLRKRMQERPDASAPRLALARLLASDDRAERAVSLLRSWLDRRPRDMAAQRRLESILRDPLERIAEADRLALERLENAPPTLERALELLEIRLRRNEPERAAQTLLAAMERPISLSPRQRRALTQGLMALTQRAINGDAPADLVLNVYDAAFEALAEAPAQLHASRLRLMTQADAKTQAMLEALDRLIDDEPEQAARLALQTAGALYSAERADAALALAQRAGQALEAPGEDLLDTWYRLALQELNADAVAASLRRAQELSMAGRLARSVFRQRLDGNDANVAAQLAMVAAQQFDADANARRQDVVDLYRLALSFNPEHAMANNNLGYLLADRGERLDEAARLIRTAYKHEPDDPAVVDSLGWVRYKLGIIADERDDEGEVVTEGAVTLLQRAVKLLGEQGDPVVEDHLGDALWLNGEVERARTHWKAARDLLRARQNLNDENQARLERIEKKLDLAAAGQRPPVAEVVRSMNVQPPAPEQRDDAEETDQSRSERRTTDQPTGATS